MTATAPSRSKRPGAQRKRSAAPRAVIESKTKPVKLTADLSAERALEALLVSAAEHVRSSRETLLASDDSEGPHQVRVGLRRLRSALHGFRSVLKAEAARHLVEQCRALARTVGELRDADVLVEDIVLPVRAQMENHPGVQPLLTGRRPRRACRAAPAVRDRRRRTLDAATGDAVRLVQTRCVSSHAAVCTRLQRGASLGRPAEP